MDGTFGQPGLDPLRRSIFEYYTFVYIEQVEGGHCLEVVHLFAGEPLPGIVAVYPAGGEYRPFPCGGLSLHADGEQLQTTGLQQSVHGRGRSEPLLHTATVLAIGVVKVQQGVFRLYLGKAHAFAVPTGNDKVRRYVAWAIFQCHFQQVAGTELVGLVQSRVIH